ncbi:MAG: toxin TcdB middle/C-terminal domain-containing protein [Pyrinomonadaceae bacterium]
MPRCPRKVPVRLFSAATHNCHIRRIQPRGDNRHAVFLVTESEALNYHYELDLRIAPLEADPRVAHTLNLRHDEYGNAQQSVAIAYGRVAPGRHADLPRADLIDRVQAEPHIAYSETRYTKDVVLPEPVAGGCEPNQTLPPAPALRGTAL